VDRFFSLTDGFTTVEQVTDTFAYNFSVVYDSIIAFITDFNNGEYFNAGYDIGYMTWMVFFIA